METKICTDKKCIYSGMPQSVLSFCKDKQSRDGFHPYCKSCTARRTKELKERDPDKFHERTREASNKYRHTEHGKQHTKEHYLSKEYREKANAYAREYSKKPHVLEKLRLKRAIYVTRNYLKDKARKVAHFAKISKSIKTPHRCEWCGVQASPSELEMHHWRGYDPIYWLDVKFVHRDKCHDECENIKPEDWM